MLKRGCSVLYFFSPNSVSSNLFFFLSQFKAGFFLYQATSGETYLLVFLGYCLTCLVSLNIIQIALQMLITLFTMCKVYLLHCAPIIINDLSILPIFASSFSPKMRILVDSILKFNLHQSESLSNCHNQLEICVYCEKKISYAH